MFVPYNEQTRTIYETVARIAREIAERERRESHGKPNQDGAA